MKKLLLAAVAMLVSLNAFAQGEVQFVNNTSSRVTRSDTGQPIGAGTSFRVQLYYAPDSPTAPTDFAAYTPVGASIGFLPGGLFNGSSRTIPGIFGGEAAWIQIRAWDTSAGTILSWEARRTSGTGLLGESTPSKIVLGGTPRTGTPTPAAALTSGTPPFTGFAVTPVPEPSTIALGVIGAAALLFLRRRK